MPSISARLDRLEASAPVLGWRLFNGLSSTGVFVEVTPRGADSFDVLEAMVGCDGNLPSDRKRWTKAEIAQLQACGWQCACIEFMEDWRADEH